MKRKSLTPPLQVSYSGNKPLEQYTLQGVLERKLVPCADGLVTIFREYAASYLKRGTFLTLEPGDASKIPEEAVAYVVGIPAERALQRFVSCYFPVQFYKSSR